VLVSPGVFVATFLILIGATTVQSALGFGSNLVAMPLVVQFAPDLVPGALLTAGLVLNLLMAIRDRSAVDLKPLKWALVGRFAGTLVGIGALVILSERGIQYVVAVAVLLMVAIAATSVAPNRTTRTMLGAGTISGFSAFTAGIGGPPVALTFRDAQAPEIRGSLGVFFIIGTGITVLGLIVSGELGIEHITTILALVPAVVIGFFAGEPMHAVVDRGWMRPAILVLSAASAIVLLLRLILG